MTLRNLRAKITLSYATLFAVVLIAIGTAFYQAMSARLIANADERLEQLSTGLWSSIKFQEGKPALNLGEDVAGRHFVRDATRHFQLYDAESSRLLMQSEDSHLMNGPLSPDEVMHLVKDPGIEEVTTERGGLRVRSAVFRAGDHAYLLRVGMPALWVDKARQGILRMLLLLSVPGVLLSGVAGWYMARHVLTPVKQLQVAAHEISITELSRRLPVRGTGDELDALAETFNQVFARLEESVGKMKQFTTSISHELRTPLAALLIETEAALMNPRLPEEYRLLLSSHQEEFQKLSSLVSQLLELARAEAGEIQLSYQNIRVCALLDSLGDLMSPVAADKGVSLSVQCPGKLQLSGDPQWLQRVFINLLDNATKFTPAGGKVRVRTSVRENHVVIETVDTGIGIAEEAIPHVFDPFYQVDPSRSKQMQGVGLGLAIAKWIVEAHHGSIQVTSELGSGSTFTVLLPIVSESRPVAGANKGSGSRTPVLKD